MRALYTEQSERPKPLRRNDGCSGRLSLLAGIGLIAFTPDVSAFVSPHPASSQWQSASTLPKKIASSTRLFLEIADDKGLLPPPPEDQLTMSGDVFALFLYSFVDHSMNDMYKDALLAAGMDSTRSLDPLDEFGARSHMLPVWFDHVHTLLPPNQLLALLSIPNVNYAPILQTAGIASIALTTCWLLCGWLSGAFLMRNTLDCHITRMLLVTGQTWLMTTVGMCALAYASDAVLYSSSLSSVGGLTKADVDYIFDSLTVLITWRFMVSAIFGGWTKK